MRTKKLSIEFEECKAAFIEIDLENLENYMSKFLALKNHERNTREILEVSGFNRSNEVRVVILIDDEEDSEKELEKCKDYAEQFGKITSACINTIWLLNDSYYPSIEERLNPEDSIYCTEWFIYRH